MTIRALAAALALSALTPLAANADAPSGEYFTVFAGGSTSAEPVPSSRDEHRNYVEFTIDDLIRGSDAMVTVEEVRRALATMPPAPVDA